MGPEPLPADGAAEAAVVFRHVANVLAGGGEDGVAVCLLEAEEEVQHLDLALDDEGGLGEEGGGGVCGFEDRGGVFGNVDGGEEGVVGGGGGGEDGGEGGRRWRWRRS